MRTLCSGADGVSCVTEHYLQQHYFSLKPDSFTEHYSSLALDKSFYGLPKKYCNDHTFTIAHIANQVCEQSAKGHKQTIEAVKILKERGIEVKVKFAGNDRNGGVKLFEKYAKELGVDDFVEFVGFLNRDGINEFLSQADIYVMPTMAEGLPRVIIEAMAKGLPCITTPVSGNPELVGEHFLVDYYDTETLADRIEELTKDSVLYEKTSRDNNERSWNYEASVLEKRRDAFYVKLRNRVNK
jgi:glycosyltransferase involved in cell wall biosynthesis